MHVQTSGIGAFSVRLLTGALQDLAGSLFAPGRTLQAEVLSVFRGRAVLAFGRGIRVEAQLQAPLQEGQRITVQVQPRIAVAESGRSEGPILLKLIHPGGGSAAAQQGQTTPVAGPVWLPIPLPDGKQGWAQIAVDEEPEAPGRTRGGTPAHRVRIWWETPQLGPVQVSLEASGSSLAALFTAQQEEGRRRIEGGLSDLQERLRAAGFPEARIGTRRPLPGEQVTPVRTDRPGRLDRRM